jgi:hypothetical protein
MIIVLTILVAIIAIYAMILEARIKALEADVKTLFEINSLTTHMMDVLHDQIGIVAEKVGIKEK